MYVIRKKITMVELLVNYCQIDAVIDISVRSLFFFSFEGKIGVSLMSQARTTKICKEMKYFFV